MKRENSSAALVGMVSQIIPKCFLHAGSFYSPALYRPGARHAAILDGAGRTQLAGRCIWQDVGCELTYASHTTSERKP